MGESIRVSRKQRNRLSTVRSFLTDGRGDILVAVAAGWFLSIGVRLAYPVLLPYLRESYGLDLTTAGLLLTALWLCYALGQLPGGLLADRFGGETSSSRVPCSRR